MTIIMMIIMMTIIIIIMSWSKMTKNRHPAQKMIIIFIMMTKK